MFIPLYQCFEVVFTMDAMSLIKHHVVQLFTIHAFVVGAFNVHVQFYILIKIIFNLKTFISSACITQQFNVACMWCMLECFSS